MSTNIHDLTNQVDKLLSQKQDNKLTHLLVKQDFHSAAQVINRLPYGKLKTFAILPPEVQAKVILGLTKYSKKTVLSKLGDFKIARFLHFNDEDDAVDVLQFLAKSKQSDVLDKLREDKRKQIEKLLKYGAETAGGLMDFNFILVKPDFTLHDVANKIQIHVERKKHAPMVVAVDDQAHILGFIPYKNLIVHPRETKVAKLVKSLPLVSYNLDQEKILRIASSTKSEALGVINNQKRLLGVIHSKDLLKIGQSEATEDIYRFAGLFKEEHVLDPPLLSVSYRLKWLIFNLITAFVAASVIMYFKDIITKIVILAAYMPIIAGEGGNAATQTLAIIVRGLALREVSFENAKYIILKELTVGLINGLIIGILVALAAVLFKGSPLLGLVIGIAMVINLIIAGLFGALVPIILNALKIDPAVSSSTLVTTATDVFGFLTLLGLATFVFS